jgi:Flp pilus assembly protein TadD
MALNELDQPEEAIETLRSAIHRAPDEFEAWRQLGIALMTVGDRSQAASAFREAVRIRPEDLSTRVDLANLLFTLGAADEAIAELEQAHGLDPGDVSIVRNLAGIYLSAGRSEPALAALREVLALRPDDALALSDAGWLYLTLGRYNDAAATFRALRRLESEQDHEVYAIHALVVTEMRRKNWRRALELAIEATRLDRFELTTLFLSFISGRLFGTAEGEVSESELNARFEAEHLEHRRLHAEALA